MESASFPGRLHDFRPLPPFSDCTRSSLSWRNAGSQDGYPALVFAREPAVALAEEKTLREKPGIDMSRP